MALVDMSWTQITIHNVVSEFLRGERESFSFYPPWLPIIDNPNLNDPLENHKRLRLLYLKRGNFMIEIPPDTTWWRVGTLTGNEIVELYVSARHNEQWDSAGNKLEQVARRFGNRSNRCPVPGMGALFYGATIKPGHSQSSKETIVCLLMHTRHRGPH